MVCRLSLLAIPLAWIGLAVIRGSLSTVLYVVEHGITHNASAPVVPTLPPFTLSAFRNMLSSFIILVIIFISCCISIDFRKAAKASLTLRNLGKGMFMGLFQNYIPFTMITIAQTSITPSIGAMFLSMTPFLTLLLGKVLAPAKVKLSVFKVLAVIFAFAGLLVACMCQFEAQTPGISSTQMDAMNVGAYFIALGAAVVWAVSGEFWSRYNDKLHFLLAAAYMNICALVIAWPVALIFDFNNPPAPYTPHYAFMSQAFREWQTYFVIVWMGAISGVMAACLLMYLMGAIGAVKATTTLVMLPIISTIEGNAVAGEWADASAAFIALNVVGEVLLIVGLILLNFQELCGSRFGPKTVGQYRELELVAPLNTAGDTDIPTEPVDVGVRLRANLPVWAAMDDPDQLQEDVRKFALMYFPAGALGIGEL